MTEVRKTGLFKRAQNKGIPKQKAGISFRLISDKGDGFYAYNGVLYQSDIIVSCITPHINAVGKLCVKHIRDVPDKDGKRKISINPDAYMRVLLSEPNEYMTMQKFLERMDAQLQLNNNAFAAIIRDGNGYPTHMYPIPATSATVLYDDTGIMHIRFSLSGGRQLTLPYTDIIHWQQGMMSDNIFGASPARTLLPLMDIVTTTDQGIVKAIKNSATVQWLVKYTNSLRPEDIKANAKQFVDDYLSISSETIGVAATAIDSGDVSGAIPEELADSIITKMKEMVPLLSEVTLFHVPGTMKFAVEGTISDATLHTENAEITPSDDAVTYITLSTYEIVKLIRISATVKLMTISAFESWITEEIARSIAYKLEGYLISGTGSSQPEGIDSITWTSGENAVQWAGASLTAAEIMAAISYLPARCDRNAKFLMKKKTMWTDIQKLRDDSKFPLLQKDGAGWMLLGYRVILSDFVDDHDIFFGDFKQVYANLPQDISVESSAASGFTSNSIDYRGVANFDSKIGVADAFVKISNAL